MTEEEDETNMNTQKLLEKASQMLMPEPQDKWEIAEMESPPTGNDFNQRTHGEAAVSEDLSEDKQTDESETGGEGDEENTDKVHDVPEAARDTEKVTVEKAVAVWMSVVSDIFSTLSVGSSDDESSSDAEELCSQGTNDDNSILEPSAGAESVFSGQGPWPLSDVNEESHSGSFSTSVVAHEVRNKKSSTSDNVDSVSENQQDKPNELTEDESPADHSVC